MRIVFIKDVRVYYSTFFECHLCTKTTIRAIQNATMVIILFLDKKTKLNNATV